jgi:hypothetical protein
MTEIKPGRELDVAVAEAVGAKPRIGKDRRSVVVAIEDGRIMRHLAIPTGPNAACNGAFVPFSPSTDLNAAFQAAEAVGLFAEPHFMMLGMTYNNKWVIYCGGDCLEYFSEACDTPALAICDAILKLKEES